MKPFLRWQYELGTHAKGRLRVPVLLEHVCDDDALFRGWSSLRASHASCLACPASHDSVGVGHARAVKISFKSSTRLRVEDTANGGDLVVDHTREEFVEKSRGSVPPLGGHFVQVHRHHRFGGRYVSAFLWIHAA